LKSLCEQDNEPSDFINSEKCLVVKFSHGVASINILVMFIFKARHITRHVSLSYSVFYGDKIYFMHTQYNSAFTQTPLWVTGYVFLWCQATGTETEPPFPSSAKMRVRETVPPNPF
jgi:hypothetical protein